MAGYETLGPRNSGLAHEFSVQLTEIESEQRQHRGHMRALNSSQVNPGLLNCGAKLCPLDSAQQLANYCVRES